MQNKTTKITKSPTFFQHQKEGVNPTAKETITTLHNDHRDTSCNNYNPLLWAWNGLKKIHQILSANCTDTYDPVNFPPVP